MPSTDLVEEFRFIYNLSVYSANRRISPIVADQWTAFRRNEPEGPAKMAWLPVTTRSYIAEQACSGDVVHLSAEAGATWRSGYATVCKTVYPGSIPGVASK